MTDSAEANASRLCEEMGKRRGRGWGVRRLSASSYRAHPSYVLVHGLAHVLVEDDQRVEGSIAHRAVLLSHKGCNLLDGLLRRRLTHHQTVVLYQDS